LDTDIFRRRVNALKAEMEKEDISCYIVTSSSTAYYLTGYREAGGTSFLLIVPLESKPLLLVYAMNYSLARKHAKGCTVSPVKRRGEFFKKTSTEIRERKIKLLVFDELSASWYLTFREMLGDAKLELRPEIAWRLRAVKDASELRYLRQAAHLSVVGMEAALESMRVGLREYEVAAEAEYAMRKRGSEGTAFETIVASGPRSAWPHSSCGDRKLEEGDAVIVDIGAVYGGYRSDMSRTAFIGQPSPQQIKVYSTVRAAQEEVFSKIKIGMKGRVVDGLATRIIRQRGYRRYVLHGVGHGVGLDIHEPPRLGPSSNDQLREGNVVTVEPGIYLDGRFGVRIEDTIVLRRSGLEVLTPCKKADY